MKRNVWIKAICIGLAALCLLCAFASCSDKSEIPDGYQDATCNGEYFRLFVPTQWKVQTQNGISGATYGDTSISLREISFGAEKTLKEFLDHHVSGLERLTKYEGSEPMETVLQNEPAYNLIYNASVNGQVYKFYQVLSLINGRFYLFTCSAPSDQFNENLLDIVHGVLDHVVFFEFPYEGGEQKKIPDGTDVPEGMKLASNKEVAFYFYVPEAWTIDLNNQHCLAYVSEEDRSNISVVTHSVVDGVTVQSYWEETKKQYEATLSGFACADPEKTDVQGSSSQRMGDPMAYTYTYSVGGVAYKTRQVIAGYGNAMYSLTYTALADTFDEHLDTALRVQEVFTFRVGGK